MGLPSGDTPQKAQDYYHYLQGHQESLQAPNTWTVRWLDLAWLWGFLAVLAVLIILWLWQYRTTRQRIYPVDRFGGYTSELAGPATLFFLVLTAILTAFAIFLIIGHIVWGQKF